MHHVVQQERPLGKDKNSKEQWQVVRPKDVPAETGLDQVAFPRPGERRAEAFFTPDEPKSCWKKPGPTAGPFQAQLGDGSVVTYYWYRSAKPALLNADLSDAEWEELQKRAEMIHRRWKQDQTYLPPPTVGTLALEQANFLGR